MSALTLYEISAQLRELQTLAESDDLPAEVIADTLDAVAGDLAVKSRNIACLIGNLEATAGAIEEAAKAMQARAQRLRRRAESVRAYLLYHLLATGTRKIECPEFVIAVRANPPAVRIAEGAELPEEFMAQPDPPPPRPDKKALLAALKAGRVIDGCSLESGERLEIRA